MLLPALSTLISGEKKAHGLGESLQDLVEIAKVFPQLLLFEVSPKSRLFGSNFLSLSRDLTFLFVLRVLCLHV